MKLKMTVLDDKKYIENETLQLKMQFDQEIFAS